MESVKYRSPILVLKDWCRNFRDISTNLENRLIGVSLFFTTKEVLKIEKNSAWDKEYASQWIPECNYLQEHGIRYTFVKSINGITTYKYEKNRTLFETLAEFYKKLEK